MWMDRPSQRCNPLLELLAGHEASWTLGCIVHISCIPLIEFFVNPLLVQPQSYEALSDL